MYLLLFEIFFLLNLIIKIFAKVEFEKKFSVLYLVLKIYFNEILKKIY